MGFCDWFVTLWTYGIVLEPGWELMPAEIELSNVCAFIELSVRLFPSMFSQQLYRLVSAPSSQES